MDRKIIEQFIKDNGLQNSFGIRENDNGKYVIININNQMSGYYDMGIINNIEYIDYDLTEPLFMDICRCVIFDNGDVILSNSNTWDGWQPDVIFHNYYNNKILSNPFD